MLFIAYILFGVGYSLITIDSSCLLHGWFARLQPFSQVTAMDFAFVVHPLSEQSSDLLNWRNQGIVQSLWSSDVNLFTKSVHEGMRQEPQRESSSSCRFIDFFQNLHSPAGGFARGQLVEIPIGPIHILENPTEAVELITEAVEEAADWGAKVVGLGSITGVVGGRGVYVSERSNAAITTGNSMTVYAALVQLRRACEEAHMRLEDQTLAVVGIPGSIGAAAARLLAPHVKRLILVGRRSTARSRKLAKELDAELMLDIPAALSQAKVILTATSTGACIDQHQLASGSIVVDVAVPADIMQNGVQRKDVLLLSGGLARVPEIMRNNSQYLIFHQGMVPSCLGETMVLALEERMENFSLGRDLCEDRILEIGQLAEKHGFSFHELHSFGVTLRGSDLTEFRKSIVRSESHWRVSLPEEAASNSAEPHLGNGQHTSNGRHITNGHHETDDAEQPIPTLPTPSEVAARAEQRHKEHINPVLIALGGGNSFARTFVRGEGCWLWDAEGNRVLDFIAGFGSLNLGHNHPAVTQAIADALANQAPGFCQTAVNPYAAMLAEKLVELAPANLEMAFFSNSGAESIEAALKLARAVTQRAGLLSCENSYHGKSLGALSVTAKPSYQRPFAPLLPECRSVPYGDLDCLEQKLRTREFAAFIVEPLQGEGGMIVPPADYLRAAQEICRRTETLLVVDEVQTGLGRTGHMFAVDAMGVEPDILTLAKSLGGGAMPIGATLMRPDHWRKAYGSLDNFALHSSTFGGGSLACAAALATLEALQQASLVENVRARAKQLRTGLEALSAKYPKIINEIRGDGLMLGVEVRPFHPLIAEHWRQADQTGAKEFLMPQFRQLISSMPALYVMNNLLSEFSVYAQVARSNPHVIRVQPPLIVSESQVDQFLQALEGTTHDMHECSQSVSSMLTKSHLGIHEAKDVDAKSPAE